MKNTPDKKIKQNIQARVRESLTKSSESAAPVILLFFASLGIYAGALFNGFVYDDNLQILRNPWIREVRYIFEIFSSNVWGYEWKGLNFYRPLMHVIYMIDYHLFGLRPWGFHLVNVLFHAGVSVLVFLIASALFRESSSNSPQSTFAKNNSEILPSAKGGIERALLSPAFVAAILFAVHPIHTEAVTWVAGLPELSFSFFFLLSFYFYIRSRQGGKSLYVLSLISFFLATLCKETALMLPVILAVYDYALREKGSPFIHRLKGYFPYLVVIALYLAMRIHALGGLAPSKEIYRFSPGSSGLSLYQYFINVFPLFSQYLEKLLLPMNLNVWHVFHPIVSLFTAKGIISLLVTLVFIAFGLITLKRNRLVFLGLCLIAVPLLPVLYIPGISGKPFAERYLYLPSAGLVLLAAYFIGTLLKKRASKALLMGALSVILVMSTVGTISRNLTWRNDYALWTDTVKKSPDGAGPHYHLGLALVLRDRVDEAMEHFKIALALDPEKSDNYVTLGLVYYTKGWVDEAIDLYEKSLILEPDNAKAHYYLGLAFMNKGSIDEAISQYEISLRQKSDNADVYSELAKAYMSKGLIDNAIQQYQTAIRLQPGNADFHFDLGVAFREKGLIDMAIEQYRASIALRPSATAYNNLGFVYFLRGMTDEAIAQYMMAIRIKPDYPGALNNLATAYMKKGLIDEAIVQLEAALKLDPANQGLLGNLNRAYAVKNSIGRPGKSALNPEKKERR